MNIFRKFVAYTHWYYAVKKADSAHERTGERYYVLPDEKGNLIVTDRSVFRKLKQKGYVSRKANVNDLIRECFYFTPYKNGDGYITPDFLKRKRAQYYSYLEHLHKAIKMRKKIQAEKRKKAAPKTA